MRVGERVWTTNHSASMFIYRKRVLDMSYLGKMLSKTYLLKINDVHVLALLKEMRERGQIQLREHWGDITETVEYTADAY